MMVDSIYVKGRDLRTVNNINVHLCMLAPTLYIGKSYCYFASTPKDPFIY